MNNKDTDDTVDAEQSPIKDAQNDINTDNNTQQTSTDINDIGQLSKLGQQIIKSDEESTQSQDPESKSKDLANAQELNNDSSFHLESSLPLAPAETTPNSNNQKPKKKLFSLKSKKSKIIFLSIAVTLLLLASVTGFLFYKSDNTISKRQQANLIDSDIYIGGIEVGGLGANKVKENLQKTIDQQKITLKINDQTIEANPTDLGINYQVDQTIQNAIKQRRPLLTELGLAKKQKIDLAMAVQIDSQKLAEYINSKVGAQLLSKNAEVAIENNQLVVKPSAQGAAIDIDDLTNQAGNIKLKESSIIITAKTSVTQPPITTAEAEKAKVELDTYIAPNYAVGNPSVGYKNIPLATKLSWLTITPDPDKKIIVAGIDNNKINESLDAFIKTFNTKTQDRVTVIIPNGSTLVAQEGSDGINVPTDALNVAKASLSSSIAQKQPAKIELVTQPIARNQKTLDGFEKMVLVNKGSYKTQAIQNGQVQKEVTVSTGKPGFETPNGTYSILRKKDISDMKGCGGGECWEVKNVKWQSYFTNEGHAIHGTWWYVNYGNQNASHGCVNMREADAEWFYNWLDIGTPVVVI